MRSFALAIATLLLLSSCTDDPGPIEPSASTSPTATATAPALPDEATRDTPDAAIAFVKHWIDVFNFAVNEGAVDEFKSLNDAGCEGCKSYEDEIFKLNRDGASVRDFKWTGGKTLLTADRQLEVAIRSSTYQVRDSKTDKWSTAKGSAQLLGFELKWRDGRWKVHQLYIPEEAT